jgi:hypothetical protein
LNRPRRRHERRGHGGPLVLGSGHPAIIEDRPLFPGMVRSASTVDRVLKSGSNSRKLGSHFSKGDWMGLPIYSLSLPERTTCPTSCRVRDRCYGNRMQVAPRFAVDAALYGKLTMEIENLASMFPEGFAVRLHALGDFPDVEYSRFWIDAVRAVPELHVFGFTAHKRGSEIGAILEAESAMWARFRMRFSFGEGQRSATVMDDPPWGRHDAGITCPADPEHSAISCGSCGLCVGTRERIVFKQH